MFVYTSKQSKSPLVNIEKSNKIERDVDLGFRVCRLELGFRLNWRVVIHGEKTIVI